MLGAPREPSSSVGCEPSKPLFSKLTTPGFGYWDRPGAFEPVRLNQIMFETPYQQMRRYMKDNGNLIRDEVLALSAGKDPFYCGMPYQVAQEDAKLQSVSRMTTSPAKRAKPMDRRSVWRGGCEGYSDGRPCHAT